MLAKVNSGALLGIDAYKVEVEVDQALGIPRIAVVGRGARVEGGSSRSFVLGNAGHGSWSTIGIRYSKAGS
jgi:magnesium chelatase family protein